MKDVTGLDSEVDSVKVTNTSEHQRQFDQSARRLLINGVYGLLNAPVVERQEKAYVELLLSQRKRNARRPTLLKRIFYSTRAYGKKEITFATLANLTLVKHFHTGSAIIYLKKVRRGTHISDT
jgi:hypothetical protein